MSRGSLILVAAEWNRSFRSIARSVTGHLEEGQFAGRCHFVETGQSLGSVLLETLAQRPDAPMSGAEEALLQDVSPRQPRALVAFDPTAGVLVSRWAARLVPTPLTVGVVASLWLDPLWSAVRLDRLIVPDLVAAQAFHQQGRAPEYLVPLGLGVCGRFGIGVNQGRPACRQSLGLPLKQPTLLLVTETLWADDVPAWIEAVAQAPVRPTLLVDAAGDRLAWASAAQAHRRLGFSGAVFGRVDEAGVYWGSADRVVGRALDHLVTRALTYRTPFWAIRPADDRQRGLVQALQSLDAGEAIVEPAELAVKMKGSAPWDQPLDASRLEMVASPSVLPRIAEAITQLVSGVELPD